MSSKGECFGCKCTWCFFVSLGIIGIVIFLTALGIGIGEDFEITQIALMIVGFIVLIIGFQQACKVQKEVNLYNRVVAVARAHEEILIDDLASLAGIRSEQARGYIFDAIGFGDLKGQVKGNTFIRSAETSGFKFKMPFARTVEKEVFVTKKLPDRCYNCGASINPQEVEWVGPDQAKCPNCGATLALKTERM